MSNLFESRSRGEGGGGGILWPREDREAKHPRYERLEGGCWGGGGSSMLALLLTAESRVDQVSFELRNPDPDPGVKCHTFRFFCSYKTTTFLQLQILKNDTKSKTI
jgi:hypothetical protein